VTKRALQCTYTRDATGRDFRDPTRPVTSCLLNRPVDRWKLQHLDQIFTLPRQTGVYIMLINVNYVYITTCQFNQMKTSRVNFNLSCLSRFIRVPLCTSCGRPVTHRSPNVHPTRQVRRPNRQLVLVVLPTGFHLWCTQITFIAGAVNILLEILWPC